MSAPNYQRLTERMQTYYQRLAEQMQTDPASATHDDIKQIAAEYLSLRDELKSTVKGGQK